MVLYTSILLLPPVRKRGRHLLESHYSVACSGRVVLSCKSCRDSLTPLGLEEDWNLERTIFECKCGDHLILANHSNEGAIAIKRLLGEDRRLRTPNTRVSKTLSHRR